MNQGKILELLTSVSQMSPTDLSKMLGVSRRHIYKLYNMKYLTSELIEKASIAFSVDPGVFFEHFDNYTVVVFKGNIEKPPIPGVVARFCF